MKAYPHQYINGEWREGRGAGELENINPYTGEVLYTYRPAGAQDVDDAYTAAQNAQKEWAATPPRHKQEMLGKLAATVASMKDEYCELLRTESGASTKKAEIAFGSGMSFIKDAARYPLMMDGKIMPSNMPNKENYVFKAPKGVIGIIVPWNVPIVLALRSVMPAIATGNAVVLKPASDTPGSAFLIAEMFDKAGFPPGLINVIAGRGSEIGDLMVTHPIPALISFTGSTEVGRRVGELAGAHLKDVSLELGGNNVMLVLEDADIERAVAAATFGAFFHQGQICMALNRVITVGKTHDAFVAGLVKAVQNLPVGDPHDPTTYIGPIINEQQIAQIESIINATIAAGATVALEGRTEGKLIYPWIFTDVTNNMPAAQHEIFGPVCSVIKAADEAEAIRLTNDTEYGLSGSVFTTDLYHGIEVARQMDSGMTHVNDQSINDEAHVMFGGEKNSGLGRFNGSWVVDKFTKEKWISVQTGYRF